MNDYMSNEEDNDEDENDIEQEIVIIDIDRLTYELYKLAILNLNVSLCDEVNNEPTLILKEKKKFEIMNTMTPDDVPQEEMDDMESVLSLDDARDIIMTHVFVNADKEKIMTKKTMIDAVNDISDKMLHMVFSRMEKEGLVELVWDSKKNDFAYKAKEHTKNLDEKVRIKKTRKKKK